MKSRGIRLAAAMLAGAIILSACGDDTQVGSEDLLEFDEQGSDAPRLGERAQPSPTAAPKQRKRKRTRQVAAATPKPAPAKTKAPAPQPAAQPKQEKPKDTGPAVALKISITGDQSGSSQFDPSAARIYEGTCAEWKNADKAPRSVQADDNSFSSGTLKPGDTWVFCPKKTGKFNYHDGTRPYAVAYIEVLPK